MVDEFTKILLGHQWQFRIYCRIRSLIIEQWIYSYYQSPCMETPLCAVTTLHLPAHSTKAPISPHCSGALFQWSSSPAWFSYISSRTNIVFPVGAEVGSMGFSSSGPFMITGGNDLPVPDNQRPDWRIWRCPSNPLFSKTNGIFHKFFIDITQLFYSNLIFRILKYKLMKTERSR